MEAVMTSNNSFTTLLIRLTTMIAVISGFFVGRVENQPVSTASPLSLYPNIETVGVALSGLNLPKTAEMMYRQTGETDWRAGHPLIRIGDGRLIGSLFGLSPATSYDVKVLNGSTEITGSVTTQPDELAFTPLAVLHVDDDAPAGGDGSAAAPF